LALLNFLLLQIDPLSHKVFTLLPIFHPTLIKKVVKNHLTLWW